jgi:hypothetical protein
MLSRSARFPQDPDRPFGKAFGQNAQGDRIGDPAMLLFPARRMGAQTRREKTNDTLRVSTSGLVLK